VVVKNKKVLEKSTFFTKQKRDKPRIILQKVVGLFILDLLRFCVHLSQNNYCLSRICFGFLQKSENYLLQNSKTDSRKATIGLLKMKTKTKTR
jgi:hypothetical protein